MTTRVLIYTGWPVNAWRIPKEQVDRLRGLRPDLDIRFTYDPAEAAKMIVDVDLGMIPFMKPEILAQAKNLRWVHSSAAAVGDLLPLDELARRGIVVTNSRGVQAIPMAEQVMAGLLALGRRLDLAIVAQKERRWIQEQLGEVDRPTVLHGKRMAIVGLGTIGEAVAVRAHAFGMSVVGVRRRPDREKPSFVERVVGPERLNDALRGADVLVIAAPLVAGTAKAIGAEQLALLNRGAVLANVGRAQIVDTTAMIRALESGQLGGAVLDVFDKEPLDPASPLWPMPNVIVTPHSAGFRAEHWAEIVDLFAENLERWERKKPLMNVVDLEAGY
ncbi:MAG TPA: D-2-hydroxyacid dehydrogenase [Gemmatimonadaceae bacterium]